MIKKTLFIIGVLLSFQLFCSEQFDDSLTIGDLLSLNVSRANAEGYLRIISACRSLRDKIPASEIQRLYHQSFFKGDNCELNRVFQNLVVNPLSTKFPENRRKRICKRPKTPVDFDDLDLFFLLNDKD